jgi:hypothetical protein
MNQGLSQDHNGNGQPEHIKHQPTDLSPDSPSAPRMSQSTARTDTTAYSSGDMSSRSSKEINKQNKRTEERKQRGMMQWKPARNAKFAKDQAKIGIAKLKKKVTGDLDGRQPGVETGMYRTWSIVDISTNHVHRNWNLIIWEAEG